MGLKVKIFLSIPWFSLLEGTSDYSPTTAKSYIFVQAFLIQLPPDHKQTTYTLVGYLLNKLHLCSCAEDAHATGWDGVWIGSREPRSHSVLGLGMCILAAQG